MPACLSCWLAGYTVRAKHTHRNSCHLLDTREARVSHAPHAHSCSLKEAQVRAAKPPKPPVAPAVHPLRSRDGADAAAAAAALRRSPRTCRFRCYPPCLSKKICCNRPSFLQVKPVAFIFCNSQRKKRNAVSLFVGTVLGSGGAERSQLAWSLSSPEPCSVCSLASAELRHSFTREQPLAKTCLSVRRLWPGPQQRLCGVAAVPAWPTMYVAAAELDLARHDTLASNPRS